jgi:hypothetical protein
MPVYLTILTFESTIKRWLMVSKPATVQNQGCSGFHVLRTTRYGGLPSLHTQGSRDDGKQDNVG